MIQSLPSGSQQYVSNHLTTDTGLQFNGHDTGDGELILKHAGKLGFEGVVSKTIDAPYAPGNRGLWRKAKALNRQEFVIVGWSDPEGSRPYLGALLLGYYTDDGKLTYAGRVGTGMPASRFFNSLLTIQSAPLTRGCQGRMATMPPVAGLCSRGPRKTLNEAARAAHSLHVGYGQGRKPNSSGGHR